MGYTHLGPPFDFLGHLTESQKIEFYKWLDSKKGDLPDDILFYRIKSQQLRKTAAILEDFNKKQEEVLLADFQKEVWEPGKYGMRFYNYKDDVAPAALVSKIKDIFLSRLKNLDERKFQMRNVRVMIEKLEDKAQLITDGMSSLEQLKRDLDALFNNPVYIGALIPKSEEGKYRSSQLDEITDFERKLDGENV